MAHLLFKRTFDFTDTRVKDSPLLLIPPSLIVGIDTRSDLEILDAAYVIQYPFIDGFGFIKGQYFKLSSNFTLINFEVEKLSKLRFLPLRKQKQLTISIWDSELMPLSNPAAPNYPISTVAASTTVASSVTSVAILAANANRKGATIWNASTAILYMDLDAAATATDYAAKLDPGGYYEVPFGFTGAISGIWSAANGSALVREFS